MTRTELLELIANGEGSGVEFKRDDIRIEDFAKELVGFLNFRGGTLLLGVEDDGSISGTTRPELEAWVMEACRVKIDPPEIPYFTWFRDLEPGKDVALVQVLAGPHKPYARVHDARRTYYIRAGSTTREAGRGELERMFQESGHLQFGLKPVPGANLSDLDARRLTDYSQRVLGAPGPGEAETESWEALLSNLGLMTRDGDMVTATVDGILLFGRNPNRFLPQSGIRGVAFPGTSPDYVTVADEVMRGPMVPLCSAEGEITENGLVEQALAFINRNAQPRAELVGGRRLDGAAYPPEVLREAIVNALVHRDYSIHGADIMLASFADRLEITSPGRLPNTATVESLKVGFRYARNQTLVNAMRDYRYVDFRGMGIRQKIIPGMLAHNGTEPGFIETEHDFTVRLFR